jgi:hypothetical protein
MTPERAAALEAAPGWARGRRKKSAAAFEPASDEA